MTVIMISDSPEFLRGLVRLDGEILGEAVEGGLVSVEEAGRRGRELERVRGERLGMTDMARRGRLKRLLGVKQSEGGEGDEKVCRLGLGYGWRLLTCTRQVSRARYGKRGVYEFENWTGERC